MTDITAERNIDRMRVNKYRAWVKSEKRYIIDTQDFIPLIVTNKGVMKLQTQFENNYYEILPLDWFIIEQFTGLYDRNGVEICEGDIIKVIALDNDHSQRGATSEHKVIENMGNFCLDTGTTLYPFKLNHIIEVIGNIHERSEDNEYYM